MSQGPSPVLSSRMKSSRSPSKPGSLWLLGLDLGQRQDPSALVLAERTGGGYHGQYAVRWGRRWPLGTLYEDVAAGVETVMSSPQLADEEVKFIADATGVGTPVMEMLTRRQLHPMPVLITSGSMATKDEGGWWHVPKRDLASVLALVLEQGRLRIAKGLEIAEQLRREMENFKIKKTAAGNELFEAATEAIHDDLVIALALSLWWGERRAFAHRAYAPRGKLRYTDPLLAADPGR